MRSFKYQIQDETGLHARPAGKLVKLARELDSAVTLAAGERQADGTGLFAVLGLGVKKGTVVTVTVSGGTRKAPLSFWKRFSGKICRRPPWKRTGEKP